MVISDRAAGNIIPDLLVIQDQSAGIVLRLKDPHVHNLLDSLSVNVSNLELREVQGTLQIFEVPNAAVSVLGTGTMLPKLMTVSEALAQFESLESTLVKFNQVSIAGGSAGKWSGTTRITDSTAMIQSFTRAAALFSGTFYPPQAETIQGYLQQSGTEKQLILRNLNDVSSGTAPPPLSGSDLLISEYIEGTSNNKYLEIFNASTMAADLSKYTVRLYINGSSAPSYSVRLDTLAGFTSGFLPPAGILILKNPAAALSLPPGVFAYPSTVISFNGDDAIELERNGVVIDVFGLKGTDPGSSWTIGTETNAAVDKSVRRKPVISQGNINWNSSSASEWNVISTVNEVSGLGER
jgi:hypothetical protein